MIADIKQKGMEYLLNIRQGYSAITSLSLAFKNIQRTQCK